MNNFAPGHAHTNFIETMEYRRFAEFCDACQKYRYIGLCYGPPGVGKTLSARHYAHWDDFEPQDAPLAPQEQLEGPLPATTAFFTAPVGATPRAVTEGISYSRSLLNKEPLRREREEAVLARKRLHQQEEQDQKTDPEERLLSAELRYSQLTRSFLARHRASADATQLLIVDEADRLNMTSLDQVRDVFDRGAIGLILIGMPGLEKRVARYAQFYSRVGFVHEFRSLNVTEVRRLLDQAWLPEGVRLPRLSDEILTAVVRITHGNFRLLNRLLTQVERIVEINGLSEVTLQVVEAARESLVIGQL